MKLLLSTVLLLSCGIGLARSTPPAHPAEAERSSEGPAQDPLRPGPQHALLQQLAGTWDAVIIGRDAQGGELRSRGTLVTTRHTEFHTVDSFQGEFLGMPLIGHGLNGYCAAKKKRFTFWTDSMTPSPMTLWGDYDAAKRELAMSGECFGRSGRLEPCRTLTRFEDLDHYACTLYGAGPEGKEMQLLRVEYTRRK